jgi:hypothetical protein
MQRNIYLLDYLFANGYRNNFQNCGIMLIFVNMEQWIIFIGVPCV